MTFTLFLKYLFLKIFAPRRLITLEYALFRELNKERKRKGLNQLFFQNDLRKIARKHSGDMARQDYFAHDNLDNMTPKDRFEAANISEVVSGENLAKVRGYANPVKTSHIGLMNSKGHRENILSRHYNCVGIGAALSENKTYYFTQNFSHRVLMIKGYPNVIRFRNTFRLKGKVLDLSVKHVVLQIEDQYGNKLPDQVKVATKGTVFNFDVHLPSRGEYQLSLFAGKDPLRLSNRFKVQKKGLLW